VNISANINNKNNNVIRTCFGFVGNLKNMYKMSTKTVANNAPLDKVNTRAIAEITEESKHSSPTKRGSS
jgi:uncharacterized pyridoxamine 5'-phosphate oxidase family protein